MACPLFLPLFLFVACSLLLAGVGRDHKRTGIATPVGVADNLTQTLDSSARGGDVTSLLQDTVSVESRRLLELDASLANVSATASPTDAPVDRSEALEVWASSKDNSTGVTEPLTDGQLEPQTSDEQQDKGVNEQLPGVNESAHASHDEFPETRVVWNATSAQQLPVSPSRRTASDWNATAQVLESRPIASPSGVDAPSITQQGIPEEWPSASRNKMLLIVRMTEVLAMAVAASGMLVYGAARASVPMDQDGLARSDAQVNAQVPDMFPPAALDAEAFDGSPLPEDVHSLLAMALIQDARLADRGAGNLQLRSLQIKADVALLVILILGKVAMLVEVWALAAPHVLLDDGLAPASLGTTVEDTQTNSYLGPKECSAFGLLQVGVFILMASFWALTCIGQIRMCLHTFWALIVVTPTVASMADSLLPKGPAPGYRTAVDRGAAPRLWLLVGLSPMLKATIASLLLLPWLGTICFLLWLGCRWLATGDFSCLGLRLLALELLLHLWGLGFSLLVPERSKREFRQVQVPLERPSIALATQTRRPSKQHGFQWSELLWAALGLLCTFQCLAFLQRTALLKVAAGPGMATPLCGCILRLANVVS